MDNDNGEEWTMCVQTAEPYVEPPNDADVEMKISKFKNWKAAGHQQIPPELWRERKRAPEGHLWTH